MPTDKEAKARLIAAAPDMLAALERAIPELNRNSLGCVSVEKMIRDAIAKATGKN